MIRIDAVWLASAPVDMRTGTDRLLAAVVQVFGAAQAHHGYLFANARGTRIKLLVHDGFGVWCAARRLHVGRFQWPSADWYDFSTIEAQCDAWPEQTLLHAGRLHLGVPEEADGPGRTIAAGGDPLAIAFASKPNRLQKVQFGGARACSQTLVPGA